MTQGKWSPQEVKLLRENYASCTAKTLVSTIQRSVRSLHEKAFTLGLHKRKLWATSEVKYLLDNYGKVNHKIIAAKLNRSPTAIRMYYMRLQRQNGKNSRK